MEPQDHKLPVIPVIDPEAQPRAAKKFRNNSVRWSVMIGSHTHPIRAKKLHLLKENKLLNELFMAWLDTVDLSEYGIDINQVSDDEL